VSNLGLFQGVPRDALGHFNSAPPVDPTQTFYRANLPRFPLDDVAEALSTGVMTAVPLWLRAGDTVTNLSFLSGATAGGTLTHWWFALYSNAATPALLAQTADQTSAAWAADTWKTLALATAQKITASGIYYAACMVAATTVPSLIGTRGAKALVTGEGVLGQTSGSSLAATATATLASPTAVRQLPLVIAT
jgi:hypothetical protein